MCLTVGLLGVRLSRPFRAKRSNKSYYNFGMMLSVKMIIVFSDYLIGNMFGLHGPLKVSSWRVVLKLATDNPDFFGVKVRWHY